MRSILAVVGLSMLAVPVLAETNGWEAVKPVFVNSCFACHAPKLAPAPAENKAQAKKRLRSQANAMTQFSMGDSFPFDNGLKPKVQLEELEEVLGDGKMPPKSQKALGLGAPLTKAEKKALLEWVKSEMKKK